MRHFNKGAVVVAHPDDETLWAGGFLARFGRRCTVICCSTPMRDSVRAEKFKEACAVYGADAVVLPSLDAGQERPIALNLDLSMFDLVVTHNEWGEYGHPHHKQVHNHVNDRAGGNVWYFGESPAQSKMTLRLSAREDSVRMRALQCYDHVLSYEGRDLPKWQALIERYGNLKPVEFYHAAKS